MVFLKLLASLQLCPNHAKICSTIYQYSRSSKLFSMIRFFNNLLLQLRNLSVGLGEEPCIGFTQENLIKSSVQDSLPYIPWTHGPC